MRKLILIKHAMPTIDESIPSKEWLLSEEGKIKSKSLANYIKEYKVRHIYTSDEQKAVETGDVICKELNLDLKTHKNLHENDTFPLWQSLGLPSLIELTIPNHKIINIIKAVD